MASVIKPIGAEVAAPLVAAATDLGGAKVFRAVNTGTVVSKVNITGAAGALIGNTSIVSGGSAIFFKSPADKIYSAQAEVLLTPLAQTKG